MQFLKLLKTFSFLSCPAGNIHLRKQVLSVFDDLKVWDNFKRSIGFVTTVGCVMTLNNVPHTNTNFWGIGTSLFVVRHIWAYYL